MRADRYVPTALALVGLGAAAAALWWAAPPPPVPEGWNVERQADDGTPLERRRAKGRGGPDGQVADDTDVEQADDDAVGDAPPKRRKGRMRDVGAQAKAPRKAPNVLIVIWDTVRADHLSLYGHDVPTTPHLERIAEQGIVFERAISPGMWTIPSHGALFTGYAPRRHGMKATYKWLDQHHVTLAEHLYEHGWDTYLFSANPYVSHNTNLTQGFQTTHFSFHGPYRRPSRQHTQGKLIPEDASTDISPAYQRQPGQPPAAATAHPYKDAAPIASEALGTWVLEREDPSRPWFGVINVMEAHIPRVPSMEARQKIMTPEQIELSLKTDAAQINLLSYTFGKREYTEAELEAMNLVYDATLLELDEAFDALWRGMEDAGVLEDTIVILTSDHGENLGDHHMFGHKFAVHDTLIHVPLVIWWPGTLPPGRVERTVSNLDLFHTVLDLVDVDPPDTNPDSRFSLLDDVEGSPAIAELVEATPMSVKRIDKLHGLDDPARWLETYQSIHVGEEKLVKSSSGEFTLYDVGEDPAEERDLSDDRPKRIPPMHERLLAWLEGVLPYDPSKRVPADEPMTVDRGTRKMLEALGYIEDEGDTDAPLPPVDSDEG